MRLRSFSLSKIIPVEIINLIIQESSDSDSTLHAFCLVSFGCFSIAGPLLNEHVQISRRGDLRGVLERITLDVDQALHLDHLPRLAPYLSLVNLKRLSINVYPDIVALDTVAEHSSLYQPRRGSLTVYLTSNGDYMDFFAQFVYPRLIQLLRPGVLRTHVLIEDDLKEYSFTSYPLQAYSNLVVGLHIPPYITYQDDPYLHPSRETLHNGFENLYKMHHLRHSTERALEIMRVSNKGKHGATKFMEVCEASWEVFLEEEEACREELERKQDENEAREVHEDMSLDARAKLNKMLRRLNTAWFDALPRPVPSSRVGQAA